MAEIYNDKSNTLLSGTSGDDTIQNGGYWYENGVRTRHDGGSNVTINTGAGNDSVYNSGYDVTIRGGKGNDDITNCSDGNETSINCGDGDDSIWNVADSVTIVGGNGKESIINHGADVIVSGDAGDDSIQNYSSNVTVGGGDGNDSIFSGSGCYNTSLSGGAGNDFLDNGVSCNNSTINGGEGNDLIENLLSSSVTISGGKGNDSIFNNCNFNSDGSLYHFDDDEGKNILFKYNSGDGKDVIYGFNETSTLSIGGGSYSTAKSGDDIIVTVGKGKISLIGAATLDAVNITGTKTSTNSWKLSGTTATYGTAIKITGVKSLDGISLSGKVVTIAASALNKTKVTISGSGYTLKLASDVTKTSTKKAWSLSGTTAKYNQTTAAGYKLASNGKSITYSKKATTTLATVSGVKNTSGLSVNDKKITVAASALNASKVTVSGTGYTLALASGVAKSSTKKAWSLSGTTATYKQTTSAGYKLASNAKSISYTAAANKTLATVKGGVKSTKGFTLSGKTIKLATSSLSKNVSVSGSYAFEFASNYNNAKITGSTSNDTIKVSGVGCQVSGGKGNDSLTGSKGADIFVYTSGDGNDVITNYDENDKISLKSGAAKISTSGNDVIFTVGKGKITLKNANGKNITYFEGSNENIYPEVKPESNDVEYNAAGTGATLKASYSKDSFEPSGTYKDILVTIDAAAVEQPLQITGNKKKNKITGTDDNDNIYGGTGADTILGGDGNDKLYGEVGNDSLLGGEGDDSLWGGADSDILTGGAGADIFIYNSGDGNDVITDFESSVDKIRVLSGDVENPIADSSGDVTFAVGDGKIVVKNGANKYIPIYGVGKNILVKHSL